VGAIFGFEISSRIGMMTKEDIRNYLIRRESEEMIHRNNG